MRSELGRIAAVMREMARAPARWRAREWLLAAIVTGAVVAAQLAKRAIQATLQGDGEIAGTVARAVSACGEGWIVTVLGVAAFLVGIATHRRRVTDAAIVFGAAGIPCWLLVVVTQFVLAESRPIEGGAMHFVARGGHGVSGHAAAAALLLGPTLVATRDASRAVRTLALALVALWALIVGWSRVELGMHYAWNVMLGLAYGWAFAAAAFTSWRDH